MAKYKIYRCYLTDLVKVIEETDDGKYADRKVKQLNEQWACTNVRFRVVKVG